MLSAGWLVEGIKEEMKFSDIVPYLAQGKKAMMHNWKDAHISFDKQDKCLVLQTMESFPFSIDFDSFVAEDWMEL
jgi:hypothetical protein